MSTTDVFARTGNAELDDALALMERAAEILEAAGGLLEDAHKPTYILWSAIAAIEEAARTARR